MGAATQVIAWTALQLSVGHPQQNRPLSRSGGYELEAREHPAEARQQHSKVQDISTGVAGCPHVSHTTLRHLGSRCPLSLLAPLSVLAPMPLLRSTGSNLRLISMQERELGKAGLVRKMESSGR